jgi:hypothetical protein
MCQPGYSFPFSGMNGVNYYSSVSSPGYQGVPPYEAFLDNNIYLKLECKTNEKELKMYNNDIVGFT